jgi:hypothetical protein
MALLSRYGKSQVFGCGSGVNNLLIEHTFDDTPQV